jgi:hypothetical protein
MNVNDFESTHTYPENLLEDIFNHQHELADKYIPIEKRNGLCLYDQIPADIDDSKAQARIKDMSWRITEEIAEAMEAFVDGQEDHFKEEIADAMHFLVEKDLLCGFTPAHSLEWYFHDASQQDMEPIMTVLGIAPLTFMTYGSFSTISGLTCNCLKNKPWKQSQMLTDKEKFMSLLEEEFSCFIDLCFLAGYDAKGLYDMYIRKNQVNQFRQRSQY